MNKIRIRATGKFTPKRCLPTFEYWVDDVYQGESNEVIINNINPEGVDIND